MRKIFYFISAAVIALGLASCNKEDALPSGPSQADQKITIIANTESTVDTKTALSGDEKSGYQVVWREGDKIFLRKKVWNLEFSLIEGAGTSKGKFVETEPSEIEDGTYDIYYATNGTELFNTSYYVAGNVISSAPMKGSVAVQKGVASVTELKNLCGLLRLRLKGSGTVKEIKVSADQALAGSIIIKDGSAKINYRGENTVIQDCGDGVDLTEEGTDFYISLPQDDYSGVVIEIKDFTGHTCTKTLKSDKVLNIARAQITPVSLNVTGLEPNIPGALAGVFTVNEKGKKVRFSKGNMYWDGDSFEFETLQSDRQTGWNSNHVNHFYWSWYADEASAMDYAAVTWPVGIFPNEEYDRNIAGHSFTVNGVTGKYRVLSIFEWEYLFEKHSHKWVTVNGVPGYVIAPDGVKLGDKLSYTNEELSACDLVFLPVTGIRVNDNISYPEVGYYWTSSMDQDNYGGYMYLSHDGVDQGATLNWACCIRLVVDIE